MKKGLLFLIASLGFPMVAFAHPGHESSSFMSGFLHPLTGIDHLLVMLAVGFWAARSAGQLRWQVPAVFVGFMLVGLVLGAMLTQPPHIELAIALSVIGMGLVIVLAAKISRAWQFALTTVFALLHGFVHGQELNLAANGIAVIAGMVLMTTALLLAGLYLGSHKERIGVYLQSALVSALTLGGTYFLLT